MKIKIRINKRKWSDRIERGGRWYYGERNLRAASRGWVVPESRIDNLGFRLQTVKQKKNEERSALELKEEKQS